MKTDPSGDGEKTGSFSVKSLYARMFSSESGMTNTLWRAKLALKINIFIWLIFHNAILTRELKKENYQGDSTCQFCNEESVHYYFLWLCSCGVATHVWSLVVYMK
jgi:hypothetical protein